ncbi:msp domain-containing [Pyrenophora seminiperda CCB06]|uniref:Msp domain-containing n=1 Tax=Pyrenophora seminiperda CCB06 TaxID=1302712 RepID=A0A3M7M465_9PLEO|nr:msp domain-containing [Pyrenophora seminiperda CCB06]
MRTPTHTHDNRHEPRVPAMSVELDPVELGFKRPFQHEVSQTLRLRNPHSDPVAFKAMKEDPPPDAKCRDKFLVQSVLITADKEFTNVGTLWSHIEQTAKSSIQEKKIRVLFLAPDDAGSNTTPAKTNGTSRESMMPSPSPSHEAVTPQRGISDASGPVSVPQDRPEKSKNLGEIKNEAFNPATGGGVQSTYHAAVATISNSLPSSGDVQAQLAEAKAQVAQLKQQLSDAAGLRQRKGYSSAQEKQPSTAMDTRQAPAGGVSVQITALLCLVSFLLAYFLF